MPSTIFLPSSVLLIVARWQCYLLPIITSCSWLHILIAVCAAFINHFSCPYIQPFSHQFTHFPIWCSGFLSCFSIFSSWCCAVMLLVFYPSLLTNRKTLCVSRCTGSQPYHGADSRGRSTLSQTQQWKVSTSAVCISGKMFCVSVYWCFCPTFRLWKLNYVVDEGPYRYI